MIVITSFLEAHFRDDFIVEAKLSVQSVWIEIRELCLLEFSTEAFVLFSSINYPRILYVSIGLLDEKLKCKNIGNRHSAEMYIK